MLFLSDKILLIDPRFKNEMMIHFTPTNFRINQIMSKKAYEIIVLLICFFTATLRERFHYLFTLGVIIRSESVFKADLCDCIGFKFHQLNELDPYYMMIVIIGSCKTIE